MSKQPFVIAPSILSADFARLGEEVQAALDAGAEFVHFDVMDNHYVPNLTIGPLVCKALRDYGITAPIDVHLMIKPVDALIPDFAKAGATYITFHPEATEHPHRTLTLIHDLGCKAGIVLNPATTIEPLTHIMDKLDMILLMSVNPGFAGQSFIESVMPKITAVRKLIDQQSRPIRLQIDGGVNLDNIARIVSAGVDTVVMGSAFFKGGDYVGVMRDIRTQIAGL